MSLNSSPNTVAICKAFNTARMAQGHSIKACADAANVTIMTMRAWLAAQRSPSVLEGDQLAKFLGVGGLAFKNMIVPAMHYPQSHGDHMAIIDAANWLAEYRKFNYRQMSDALNIHPATAKRLRINPFVSIKMMDRKSRFLGLGGMCLQVDTTTSKDGLTIPLRTQVPDPIRSDYRGALSQFQLDSIAHDMEMEAMLAEYDNLDKK